MQSILTAGQKTMKKKHFSNIKVYAKMLKYPMFPIVKDKEVTHYIGHITVTMSSSIPVNTNTEEKLFALLYLIRNEKAKVELLSNKEIEYYVIKCNIKDLAKACSTKDYKNIIDELENLLRVTFTFSNPNNSKFSFTSISAVKYDASTGNITVVMNSIFYRLCNSSMTLHINFEKYQKLPPAAKNVYKYLIANSDREYLLIDTIKERCHINTTSKHHTVAKLKTTAELLKKENLLKSFKINYPRFYFQLTFIPIPNFKNNDQDF